jgi:predicted amidohydrolase YtcJ
MLLDDAQGSTPLKISWAVTSRECLYAPPDREDETAALHSRHAPRSVKFFLDGAHRTAASMPVIAGVKAMVRAGCESASQLSLAPLKLLFEQKIHFKDGRLALPYQRFTDDHDLLERAAFFTDKGYRLVIHALGNVAARQAARLINALKPTGGASVEHLLVMDEKDLDCFAGCASVASIQPGFIPGYADAIERMGALPYLKAFALQSMKKRGIPICISSDGPCGPDDPLYNARRAADRMKPDGTMLDPDEMISREDALAAASIGGSLSMGMNNEGLCAGAPATFCVVDGDPFSDSSRVVQTWIDGVRAY